MLRSVHLESIAIVAVLVACGLFVPGSSGAVIINVGHRGFSSDYPENTLIAIERAIVAGADMVEIDLQKSSDGKVVIFHDDTVNRTTSFTGPVSSYTAAQLEAMDAGSWFAPEFSGQTIPSLEDALLQAKGLGPILLDQKSGVTFGAEIAAAVATTAFPLSDLWVTAWEEAQVLDIQAQLPGVPILWTATFGPIPPAEDVSAFLDNMQALGVTGFSLALPHYTGVDVTFLGQAQGRGFLGFAWNLAPEPSLFYQIAIDIGLDGYIVNNVAAFEAVIPEPATLPLFGLGLAFLGIQRRRRGC